MDTLHHWCNKLNASFPNIRALAGKSTVRNWTATPQEEFKKVKEMASDDNFLSPYDPNKELYLQTYGCKLGVSLLPGRRQSSTIPSTSRNRDWRREKVQKEIPKKKNAPIINVHTDHSPLKGVFNNDLSDMDNPWVVKLLERTLHYNIQIEYVSGKSNKAAGPLSKMGLKTTTIAKIWTNRL